MNVVTRYLLTTIYCLLLVGCSPLRLADRRNVQVAVDSMCDAAANAESEELLLQAQKQIDHGRLDKAEQTLIRAIELNPDLGPAHNNLGLIYFGRRQLYEAAHAFNKAILLMPGSGLPHNNLGMVLEEGGRNQAAIEQYEIAYSLEPNVPEFIGNLARARLVQEDFSDETIFLLQELIFLDTRREWIEWARDELHLKIPISHYAVQFDDESQDADLDRRQLDHRELAPPQNLSPSSTDAR